MKVLRSINFSINNTHELFNFCYDFCYKNKNLYNYTNFLIRQSLFIHYKLQNNKFLSKSELDLLNNINNSIKNFNNRYNSKLQILNQEIINIDVQLRQIEYLVNNEKLEKNTSKYQNILKEIYNRKFTGDLQQRLIKKHNTLVNKIKRKVNEKKKLEKKLIIIILMIMKEKRKSNINI